jgi:hypothetical protein
MDSTDLRCCVPPQLPAEPTYADYAGGRDLALEAIHAAIAAAARPEPRRDGGR